MSFLRFGEGAGVGVLDEDLEWVRGPAGSGMSSLSLTGDRLCDLVPAAGPVVVGGAGPSARGTGVPRGRDGGGGVGGRGGVGWS